MYFHTLHDLLTMEGHGPYVWGAYSIGLIVLLWNVIQPVIKQRTVIQNIQRAARRERQCAPSSNANQKGLR